MSLRRKTLLAIAFTFAGLFVLLFILSQVIILNQFDHLQTEAIRENIQRARNTIDKEIDNLSTTDSDWGYWDDTYQFVQDGNLDYIESNLTDDTFKNLNLNFMIYVDKTGKTVYGRAFNFETQQSLELPKDLIPQNGVLSPLLKIPAETNVNKGIILTSHGPVLVASRAILNSLLQGPAQGVLIIGRYLDQREIAEIAEQTQLSLNLIPLNAPNEPLDFLSAQSALLLPNANAVIYTRKAQTAQGYSLLSDYAGQPAFILQVETPDNIYEAGQKAVVYFLLAMLLIGVVLGAVILWWIETRVLARIAFLDRRMTEIGDNDDLSARIAVTGDDELARLAVTINDSLAKREQSQEQKLRDLNTALKQANGTLEEKIDALRLTQKYKDRFFAHASHEFRTPLAIMGTRLYLAKKKPELWDTHIQVLEETQRRLLDVVDDVFDMTKLQDNNLTLNMQKMDLKSFMPMILDDVTPRFRDTCTRLTKDFTTDDLPVKIDVILFGRACEKLINFMLDFSGPDNEIVINLSALNMGDKPVACIEMCSTSFHFEADEMAEMFSPFYQVSEGKFHTTGLNLAIAKQIIEVHQSTLVAHTEADILKGGCFKIMMPLVPNPTD
jgi:sensor domain CHASE-containing protein